MQEQEEQSGILLDLGQAPQPERKRLVAEREGFRFPFSRTFKNFVNLRRIKADLLASNWVFSPTRLSMILAEMSDWNRSYLPIDMSGLTVLDIGAGEGETAKFFLDHGAAKVICVEPCTRAYHYLARNTSAHPEIKAINKRFMVKDVCLPHDFLKCDIEGYEEVLLDVKLPAPAAVEVHGLQLRDKFERAGWRIANLNNANDYGCTSYAYWLC